MAVLHIINRTPSASAAFARCLALLAVEDGLILIENGVYAALRGVLQPDQLNALAGVRVYVLQPDLDARALHVERCVDGFERIDYAGFVDLVAAYDASITWG